MSGTDAQLLFQIIIFGAAASHSLLYLEEIPVVLALRFRESFYAFGKIMLGHAVAAGHQGERFYIRERIQISAHAGKQFLDIFCDAVTSERPAPISRT